MPRAHGELLSARRLCVQAHAAGRADVERRQDAVRAPWAVLDRFERGELTLSSMCLLRPHLTDENCLELLDAARHASKRDVERLIAGIAPQPDVPAVVRKLPAARVTHGPALPGAPHMEPPRAAPACELPITAINGSQSPAAGRSREEDEIVAVAPPSTAAIPSRPMIPLVRPLAPERYKVQFTVGRDTHDKLRRAQDLLRHAIPDGDPAAIFDRALSALLEQLERSKLGAARAPRPSHPPAEGSRHIPAAVRRAVWKRDEGRCAFEGPEGRCGDTGFLEFHHLVPFARGGRATADNIQLRCRAHNQYHAVEEFGALFVREAAPAYVVNSTRLVQSWSPT